MIGGLRILMRICDKRHKPNNANIESRPKNNDENIDNTPNNIEEYIDNMPNNYESMGIIGLSVMMRKNNRPKNNNRQNNHMHYNHRHNKSMQTSVHKNMQQN